VDGARLYLGHSLEEGTLVVLKVCFPSPTQGVSIVHFEGTVVKAAHEPQYEVAIQFHRGGRFVRDALPESGSRRPGVRSRKQESEARSQKEE
jgi:hypothetical protein